MTIKETIIKFSNILQSMGFESANLDVEILLCFVLKCDRIDLINNSNYELKLDEHNKFLELFLRREKHEPIAYLIGEKEFCSYKFFVNKNVLIPRPLTEELVEIIFEDIIKEKEKNNINIIDVGTGSGAIIISLFNKINRIENIDINKYHFFASDISRKALEVAKMNADRYEINNKINFLKGNLKFPRKIKFDYIVANLPYLNESDIDFSKDVSKDLRYEPKTALFARFGGFYIVKRFIKKARKHINKDGIIYLEIEKGQIEKINKLFGKIFDIESFYEDRFIKLKLKKR